MELIAGPLGFLQAEAKAERDRGREIEVALGFLRAESSVLSYRSGRGSQAPVRCHVSHFSRGHNMRRAIVR